MASSDIPAVERMRHLIRIASFAVACLGLAEPGFAQSLVSEGDRIRVTVLDPEPARLVGVFVATDGTSVSLLTEDDAALSLAFETIHLLEISDGRRRVAGTLVGVVAGAFLGGFIGAGIERGLSDSCFDFCGIGGFVIGFGVGAVGGGFAGNRLLSSERWRAVPRPFATTLGSSMLRFQIPI